MHSFLQKNTVCNQLHQALTRVHQPPGDQRQHGPPSLSVFRLITDSSTWRRAAHSLQEQWGVEDQLGSDKNRPFVKVAEGHIAHIRRLIASRRAAKPVQDVQIPDDT